MSTADVTDSATTANDLPGTHNWVVAITAKEIVEWRVHGNLAGQTSRSNVPGASHSLPNDSCFYD